jgi:hypothetical protein
MPPKVWDQILENMQKEGHFTVSKKEYNDKNARAALKLKYKGILDERTRKLVDMLHIVYTTSLVDLSICRYPFAAGSC